MSNLVFDESYFHGSNAGYTDYSRNLWPPDDPLNFAQQAQDYLARASERGLSLAQRKVLIVGAGFGFTVEYLVNLGADAYGLDISAYAVSQAPPSIASRMMVGDALSRDTMNAAKTLAGLRGNARFDLLVTEDLLPCLTDPQVTAGLVEWRRVAQRVMHRISTGNYEGGYNLKTLAQWRALIGAGDWIFEYATWQEG